MHKDAGKDNNKYFLIPQMNSFNLDKVLALLTVLESLWYFLNPHPVAVFAQLYPVPSYKT